MVKLHHVNETYHLDITQVSDQATTPAPRHPNTVAPNTIDFPGILSANTITQHPVDEGPQPLIREVGEPAQFPTHALGPLREAAEAIAINTEAPIEMCVGSILAAASLATQGRRDVQTVMGRAPISLFILTIAESGERKSTADRLAMRGIRQFEKHQSELYEIDFQRWQSEIDLWKSERAKILGNKKTSRTEKRVDLDDLGPEPEPPLTPNLIASSPTFEGVTKNLPTLSGTLGIMTEEGAALLGGHSMKAENRMATCAGLSQMWDATPIDRWRAGDEGVRVHSGRRFSAHILVQNDIANNLLADRIANGQGLLARFLTCRPRSLIGQRLRMSEDPQATRKIDQFADRIFALLRLGPVCAEGKRNELEPPLLELSSEAATILRDYALEIERGQAEGGPLEHARASSSKSAEQAVRMAAVMTVFENPEAQEVTGKTMADAVELARFYCLEAARLYGAAAMPAEIADAEKMRIWLIDKWPEQFISTSVAANRGPFQVTRRAQAALRTLQNYGWLKEAPGAVVLKKPRKEAWEIIRPDVNVNFT